MAKRIQVGGRIESKEVGGIVTGAAEILDDAKGKKQSVINEETDDELVRLDQSKQDNLTFDNAPTEGSDNPVKSGGVYAADKALSDAIEAILLLIPSAASALNKLVDTSMMNSSISTATATFRGTYNVVTDLSLTVDATHEQIAAKLAQMVSEADNNDYAFVQIPVSAESTDIRRTERYKFNGTAWGYEYDLNTSGFTAAQWAAINSGITLALVGKLIGLPTSSELQALLGQKQDTLTFDNVPTAGSANPVKSGGVYSAINDEKTAREQLAQTVTGIEGRVGDVEEVIPTGAAANNKLVANNSMEAYVTSIIEAITASFTIATADGHINLTLTQTNGRVASLTLTTSDIASAQALTALTGRVSTAEGNITTLGGRVSTNETDIANLQQLYNDLQQSKPVPVTALPETGQQQGVIYRLAGTTSYSDYMWNGSTWVLMATYNNAIDSRPKKASQNLVTSGGVFDNMGALDVSELNATENPHTLAQYADLSAALAAIPTDYQKGGMSIKFVQSSDNKYVQYRLMADSWSIDTEDWAIANEGVYVENPEFVYVKTDNKGRILWAIKTDGSIYYGAGVPQQVIDYIEKKLADLSLDEYEDIVAFLSDYLGSDTTLKALIDGINAAKLDKEGLDPDALATVQAVENPEYIQATIDSEDKMLEGITSAGVKQINIPIETPSVTIEHAENPEFINATTDNEGKILEGFSTNGKKIVNVETLFDKVKANTVETDYLEISEKGRQKFRNDFVNDKFVIQNLPEIAKFSVDAILKDFSTEVDEMPLSTNLFTILYEQMDILMQTYPEFITKVDLFEYVENEMNALGVTDYPFYANGINEEIENEYTFPDGSTTTFTYEITPAYKTYMYIIDFSSDWWANDNFNKHKNILLIGGTHGSEKQSIINLYLFTKLLCSGTIDKNYFALRNSCKFYIVPMLSGYSVLHELRNNANGININRNFPCKNGFVVSKGNGVDSKGYYYNYTGPEAYSEFETKLVKCLVEKITPEVAIDHHSYGFEMPCQLYYDVLPNTEVARCYYQSSIDISHALQKAYPEYFGTNGKILIDSNSYIGPRDGNNTQTMGVWFYNIMGIRFSSTIEVSHFLNYENGEPISRAPIYDTAYRKKVFAVSEYTLRVSLIRLLERLFVVNN